jgi:hypothetical protein
MRTTVEFSAAEIALLRTLAAERGQKGYSKVLSEALAEYAGRHAPDAAERRSELMARVIGSITDEEAAEARRVIRELRANWRTDDR